MLRIVDMLARDCAIDEESRTESPARLDLHAITELRLLASHHSLTDLIAARRTPHPARRPTPQPPRSPAPGAP